MTGPLIVAENMQGAKMFELVKIGWQNLIGEIIKLDRDQASIQCYEDTSGLTVGDPIIRTKHPLSVELGPGILGNIFDGIQRPLDAIAQKYQQIYVPKGVDIPSINQEKMWEFHPSKDIQVGSIVSGGDIIGNCYENSLFNEH